MKAICKEVRIRQRWYWLVNKQGKTVKEVCETFGISRKTYYYWYNKDHGSKERRDKRRQPNLKLTPEIKEFIYEEKLKYNYGPLKMKVRVKKVFALDVSTTIIYRYYRKRDLIRKPQRKQVWYQPIKQRVVPKSPGELVQLDIKFVWTAGGLKYQRTFLDVFTRLEYAVVHDSKRSIATIAAFTQAEAYFGFKINCLQTDNGGEFHGEFHAWLLQHSIVHLFIPKGTPQWNGHVERAHRSIDDEYYLAPWSVHSSLSEYLGYYNNLRPHLGKNMNGLTPREKLLEWKSVTMGC